MRSGMVAQGPEVAAFEREFSPTTSSRAARRVAVNSGTSGLHLGLLAAGIGPGDEVIVPSFTFAATANSVALTGATPVFADIEPDTLLPRPGRRRGRDHRAHQRRSCRCTSTATRRDMPSCSARRARTGSRSSRTPPRRTAPSLDGRPVGTFGAFAMFCLYPTKNMTSGEGGMVSLADDDVARRVRLLRNQGMERQYANEVVGFNARMTDIHAAIGRVQLTKVAGWTAQRQRNAAFLDAHLRRRHAAGRARAPRTSTTSTRSGWPSDRDGFVTALREEHQRRHRRLLPDPEPPAALARAVRARPRPARTERAAARSSRCRCTRRCAQDDLERIVAAVNAVAKGGA